MKKLISLISVVAVAGAISTASASDRTGKIGIGAQESFTSGGVMGSASLGAWSIKYGISHNINGEVDFGFNWGNKTFNKAVEFGGRLLYDLVEMENSDFYTGLGIGWNQNSGANGLRFQVPLGFEFNFAGLPEVGFSFEGGIVYDYFKDPNKQSQIHTVGGNVGGALGLGVHYYF
jgi:hypothetical protein